MDGRASARSSRRGGTSALRSKSVDSRKSGGRSVKSRKGRQESYEPQDLTVKELE